MNKISTPSDQPENAGTVQSAMRWLEPGALSKSSLLRQAFADEPALQPGDLLGAYQIEHELARGGMGVVYVAARADGQYQQRVAIKVLPGSRSEQLKELFVRERQLLADFRHPHIARLIDGGQASDGLLWCAMELVDGLTLDAHIARHQPNLHQRVDWLLQICAAVSHAHARLLIHRDIKPNNVMIDSDGSAKLLDFGIASWSSGASESSAYSPKWASPEQIAREAVGPASDQYQLGMLLEKLALPLAPSGERGAELRAIAARATQALSEQRFASVSEFSDELKCWLNLQPVPSYARSFSYQLRAAVRRNPYQTALLSAALALVIGLTAFNQWRLQNERDSSRQQAARAQATSDFLVQLFEQSDPSKVSVEPDLRAVELIRRGAAQLDAKTTLIDADVDVMRRVLSRILLSLGDANTAVSTLAPARAQMDAASLNLFDARVAQIKGDMEKALALYQLALKANPDPVIAVRYGRALLDVGKKDEAAQILTGVLQDTSATPGIKTAARSNLAVLAWRRGNLQEAIALNTQILAETGNNDITAQLNLGQLYADTGAYADAQIALNAAAKALDVRPNQLRQLQLLNSQANLAMRQNQLTESEQLYLQTIALADNGANPGMEAIAINNLAMVRKSLRRFTEALQDYLRAAALRDSLGDRSGALSSRINIAELFPELGLDELALASTDALVQDTITLGDSYMIAKAQRAGADVYFDYDKAISYRYAEGALKLSIAQQRKASIRFALRQQYLLGLRWSDSQIQSKACLSLRADEPLSSGSQSTPATYVCTETQGEIPAALQHLSLNELTALAYQKDLQLAKQALRRLERWDAAELSPRQWRAMAQAYQRLGQMEQSRLALSRCTSARNEALTLLTSDPHFASMRK